MATVANIFIDQGSDYSNIVTVTASNGQPLNLTGYTVSSQMRKSYTSTTAYAFAASILDAATGKVRLQLSSSQSEVIPPGRYLYDVEVTSPASNKTRVVEGIATITPQITQV
jgi:hypothetical protein